MNRTFGVAVALLLPLAACSDLFLESGRVPTSLVLADSVVTAVEGLRVEIGMTVLDQDGRAFRRLPPWVAPVWASDGQAVAADADGLIAVAPGQAQATVRVMGMSATARVRVNPASLRLAIASIQLTQAAQPEGGVHPLVQGRDATLRVFLQGDRLNFFGPQVRVKVYHGEALARTLTASASAIPTTVDPTKVEETWNVQVPAELVVPGLRLLVEADPEGMVPRSPGSVATHPASGVPLAADVRAVPPLYLRMVPIRQAGVEAAGAVDAQNIPQFLQALTDMFPLERVHADLHATYSTTTVATTAATWSQLLREMYALRTAEGARRYYYGVLRRSSTGFTGYGYIGQPAAVGWDPLPAASFTLAHELGHNFGRLHAPCGNPARPDPAFPTPNANLDAHGWNVRTGQVMAQRENFDLMSYCAPRWITSYTWRAVLDYRQLHDWARGPESAAPEPVLLVWGSVRGGEVVLEPAFELTAPPTLPERAGPYRLEWRDAAGATLFSLPFDGVEVMDGAPGERHFAFAVPRRALRLDRAASLHLHGAGGEAVRASRLPAGGLLLAAAPRFSAQRADAGGEPGVALRWASSAHPMVLVRDPATGEVLSFARGGAVEVRTGAAELELLFSDGVRTTLQRVRVP